MKYLLFIILSLLVVALLSLLLFEQFDQPVSIIDEPNSDIVEIFSSNQLLSKDCSLEQDIQLLLSHKQPCETANDCLTERYGCPFGCKDNVNKTNHLIILEQVRLYRAVCENQCRYRCVADGVKNMPACIDKICSELPVINGTDEKYKMIE